MEIEKFGNRYRVKHEIGFFLYGNSEKEVLHKIAILENMKNKGGIKWTWKNYNTINGSTLR